eukprot:1878472-Pleurochrysis_carterae.AAC.4
MKHSVKSQQSLSLLRSRIESLHSAHWLRLRTARAKANWPVTATCSDMLTLLIDLLSQWSNPLKYRNDAVSRAQIEKPLKRGETRRDLLLKRLCRKHAC